LQRQVKKDKLFKNQKEKYIMAQSIITSGTWTIFRPRTKNSPLAQYGDRLVISLSPKRIKLYISDEVYKRLGKPEFISIMENESRTKIGLMKAAFASDGFKVTVKKGTTTSISIKAYTDKTPAFTEGIYEGAMEKNKDDAGANIELLVFEMRSFPTKKIHEPIKE
jgi:hypothetical protein